MPGYWNAHSDRDFEDPCHEPPNDDEVEEERHLAQCDCCGEMVHRDQIGRLIAYGIETFACDKCRGE